MQQPNLAQIFENVDRDRNGQISIDELQSALSNGSSSPFNPETCRLIFGMFDSNRDGAIDFREFEGLWNYVNEWTRCFRSFDRDNSGSIDHAELAQALTEFGYRLSAQLINILVLKFDRTQSNSVNFDDFIQLCVALQTLTAAFRHKDTDHDNVITIGFEEFLSMVFSLNM
ncbi:hypothetical protein QR680_008536 [Steinernema hermaphroditum]|uniref:EF-hand domain-containing protein n=1 Tax=Steinernema hermaphroditum TaxID=289476 RepID=A0AA39M7U6_9BILA|nr:hypothetical protein QR680_008536 [Steinernema hermaphroditum]